MNTFRSEKHKNKVPLLLYPPLIEAIFELHWELQQDPRTKALRDPSYPMMYGRLYEQLKADLPYVEDLPSVQVQPEANPYVVRHRMRKEKNGYPLMQIGPGIATVNAAKGYSWSSFKGYILKLAALIPELFPTPSAPLNFMKCELRYFNGVRCDIQKENPLAILADKLHVKISMDPEIFSLNEVIDQPNAVNFNVAYPLMKPKGHLALSAHLGQMEGLPAYLFQTQVVSIGETVPIDAQGFETWASNAHDVAENCFMALCKGKLMDKFRGEEA